MGRSQTKLLGLSFLISTMGLMMPAAGPGDGCWERERAHYLAVVGLQLITRCPGEAQGTPGPLGKHIPIRLQSIPEK